MLVGRERSAADEFSPLAFSAGG